eukprot:scaffold306382_cov26-Tisochrysis_lutea.AAC.1
MVKGNISEGAYDLVPEGHGVTTSARCLPWGHVQRQKQLMDCCVTKRGEKPPTWQAKGTYRSRPVSRHMHTKSIQFCSILSRRCALNAGL